MTEVNSTNAAERVEQIVDFLDMRSVWSNPAFEGTAYEHALPVFEALYRWTIRGHFQRGDQQAAKADIERAAAETWAASPLAAKLITARISMIQSIPSYATTPISQWPKERLFEEWVQAKEMVMLLNTIKGILGDIGEDQALGVAGLEGIVKVPGVAARLGQGGVARALTVVRVGNAGGLAITIVSGVGIRVAIYWQNKVAQEITEEIENVRIPKGEITKSEWDSLNPNVRKKYDQ